MSTSTAGPSSAGPTSRTPQAVWWLSRLSVLLLTVVSAHVLNQRLAPGFDAMVARWQQWDADYYVKLAQHGYPSVVASDPGSVAFYPGQPLAVRLVHLVARNWTLSALVVSAVAGAVAVQGLWRLARLEQGDAVVAERTVLYLVLSPFAVFLAAGYSEAPFLAFAVWSWWFARRGRWAEAGVLAGLSAFVRVTGLFLGVALLVEYAVTRWRSGHRRPGVEIAWLTGPFVATAAYFGYLWHLTGDALAWVHAQSAPPWTRHFTLPWDALRATFDAARDPRQTTPYAWAFGQEIVCVAVGLALLVWLVRSRRWGETAYVGLQWLSFALSAFYLSVGRATLLWWPLWLALAAASVRRPWLHRAYLTVMPVLMATYVIAFTGGGWVG